MLNLETICISKQNGLNDITDPTIIKSLANYENTVNEGYQGRLLFELIQNARDAAHKANIDSRIIVVVENNIVYVGNTGAPFDEKGITAMTRLGVSDKSDSKTIGHKGIGFKAIQEYSSTPRIITRFGTIYFDKTQLHKILSEKFPGEFNKSASVPLFYYPHYDPATIENIAIEILRQCETVIAFNLNKGKTPDDFVNKFKEISNEELILLQNIESISLYSHLLDTTTKFKYNRNKITVNDDITFEIIRFPRSVLITDELYGKLSEKEQQLFEIDREVDIQIVFRLNEEGLPVPEPGSNLYLFYPLEMKSGFPYKIHSYFSCNPQRTSITESNLNNFIFEKITELQINYVLPYLKKKNQQKELLQFIYIDTEENRLHTLYDTYLKKLNTQKFIWVEQEREYYSPEQIMLCDIDAYDLLSHHKIDGKTLVMTEESIAGWLKDKFGVIELDGSIFSKYIEPIAEAEMSNPDFFRKLYHYISDKKFIVSNKKILLGEDGGLYCSTNKVFMQGNRQEIKIPQSIQNKITMLHPGIDMEDISESDYKRLGIKPFSQEDIVDRALELFNEPDVNNSDIIIFFLHFKTFSTTVLNNIRRKILVPVGENVQWLSPLYHPVYIEDLNLRELYPNGNFINYKAIANEDQEALNKLFLDLNVWKIPAVYFVKQNTINSRTSSNHNSFLNKSSGFSSSINAITNDRKLDFPHQVNDFFFHAIIENWSRYLKFIKDTAFMNFSVKSSGASYKRDIFADVDTTSFGNQLRENKWIRLKDSFFRPSEVVGINRAIYLYEKHLKKDSFNWLVMDYDQNEMFFTDLNIKHLNSDNREQLADILMFVKEIFTSIENQPANPEFKRFYHTLLKYLYTTFELNTSQYFKDRFTKVPFLSIYHKNNVEYFSWQMPENILHIDDTKLYQSLSDEAKSHLGYFFTKSDKNEIGKFFRLIAPRLSSRISEEVIYPSEIISEKLLYTEIKSLVYIILLIEDDIEDVIKYENLQKIRHVKINMVDKIARQTSVTGGNEDLNLPETILSYYFNARENNLYISSEHSDLNKEKKLFAEIINEVISVIIQKDFNLKSYIRDLLMGSQSDAYRDARNDIQFDPDRLANLQDLLNDNSLNEEQMLWDAIVKCKCPENKQFPFSGLGQTDREMLADILSVTLEQLNKWYASFDYYRYDSEPNIDIVQEIVEVLCLDFNYLNDLLNGKLNFEAIYNQRYLQSKNKYADTLKYNAYTWLLATKDSVIQSSFQAFINAVENIYPEFSAPRLYFNAESDFLNKAAETIKKLGCPPIAELTVNYDSQWRKILNETRLQSNYFHKRIRKSNADIKFADEFISKDEHYSLLYFRKAKELANKYIEMYPAMEEEEAEEIPETQEASRLTESAVEDDGKQIITLCTTNLPTGNPIDDLNKQLTPKSKASGGSYSNPMIVNGTANDETGEKGELLMFNKLSKLYDGKVTWVSEYAKKYGYPPVKKAVGYDMYYVDKKNNTHYVEVKTRKGNYPEFIISINEIRAALSYKEYYHVIWITNVDDIDKRQYADLGNIFINFEDGEDFFYNSRFKAFCKTFKIIFSPEFNTLVPQILTDELS